MEQDSFFLTDEARRIAENVLAFQRCTGGWPKNIDMARRMNDKELAQVMKDKSRCDDSTIDNNATTAQMIFLARLYRQTKDIRYRDAFKEWNICWAANTKTEDGRNSGPVRVVIRYILLSMTMPLSIH